MLSFYMDSYVYLFTISFYCYSNKQYCSGCAGNYSAKYAGTAIVHADAECDRGKLMHRRFCFGDHVVRRKEGPDKRQACAA